MPKANNTFGKTGGSLKVATTPESIMIIINPKYGTRSRTAASKPRRSAYLMSNIENERAMTMPCRKATVSAPRK